MKLINIIVYSLVLAGWAACAHAQADEIQVYDGGLAEPGKFTLTWHNNYTFQGSVVPDEPGAIPANHALNGVTEWAYGVNDWLEVGLYLPLYTLGSGHAVTNGFKLRALVATPDAAKRTFFYGLGFEFSQNAKHWDSHRTTSEFRPIVGWHLGKWDVILNPILDTAYDGFGKVAFAPSTRVAYNFSERYALAVEEYADFGQISDFAHGSDQSHQLFGVFDFTGGKYQIQTGLGFGLTRSTDDLVGKFMVAFDLN